MEIRSTTGTIQGKTDKAVPELKNCKIVPARLNAAIGSILSLDGVVDGCLVRDQSQNSLPFAPEPDGRPWATN
jgi:hypothetical protein